jgi:transposase
VIGALVRNLVICREPIYGLAGWAGAYLPSVLGLDAGQAAALGDDRVGRALDALFDADRASMLTTLTLRVIDAFEVSTNELHNDSTSIRLAGAYRAATGRVRGGQRAPAICRGHSKDHRPDLKQLVWILTVARDGAVPISYRAADGNTTDDPTHIPTWCRLRDLLGRADFLYVADCKLAHRTAMDYINAQHGRFLSVLPRSRGEDAHFRDLLAAGHDPGWEQIHRRAGRRVGDPDEIWWAAPAPTCSAEGYRIVWLRSAAGMARDAALRSQRLRDGCAALEALGARLANPRSRLASRAKLEAAIAEALARTASAGYLLVEIIEHVEKRFRQARRGHPGPATDYRRTTRTRYQLSWRTNHEAVRAKAASDGCWPLITNDQQLSPAELFDAYHHQPAVEGRHHLLKGVLHVAPVWLHSEFRIDALGFCFYLALLVHALIERECRNAMTTNGIRALPLYPEDRNSVAPTTTRLLDQFTNLDITQITAGGTVVKTIPPQLNPLQRTILDLLRVPARTYRTT